VGERQLEVALVEHLCSYFLAARGSDPVQLVSVPLPRFDAVEGRRGHATTGRSVDQLTGTAKSLELLECGQDSHLVEIDASVDLIRADLGKGAPITFDTLFKPGTNPLEVLNPIVQRKFGPLPFGDPGVHAYQNFAITDDGVIFFFNQGQVLAQLDGPQKVSVPRAELASLLASP
jgi:hypothetical protein